MARKQQGTVLERSWKSGPGFALRVWAYGERHYVTLGTAAEGWDRAAAEEELANIAADVRRQIWVPPPKKGSKHVVRADQNSAIPNFGPFARTYLKRRKGEIDENSWDFLEWAIEQHLIPFLENWPLDLIVVQTVDDLRGHLVAKSEERRRAIERGEPLPDAAGNPLRPLKASTINKVIDVLQQILSLAVEYYESITTNVAAGRRRRLRVEPQPSANVDTLEQVTAIVEAAAEMDEDPVQRIRDRDGNTSNLIFEGHRAHEHCATRLKDYDLAHDRVFIRASKTQAGIREVTLLPIARQKFERQREKLTNRDPGDLVYPSRTGSQRNKDNLRNRVVYPVFERASVLLVERGHPPLPDGLTVHKLRKVFASIRFACGGDPVVVMREIGHTDPHFSMKVYTHMMGRSQQERDRLKAFVMCTGEAAS
jgi:integrase